MTNDKWLQHFSKASVVNFRIICFHQIGGSAAGFNDWQRNFADDVDVCAVQLPGRWDRVGEEPYRTMETLVDALAPKLASHIDVPYAVVGYSLGGLIAFETLCSMARENLQMPVHLFVIASPAPNKVGRIRAISHLPNDEFIIEVQKRYQGLPKNILKSLRLQQILLPPIRSDLEIIESYEHDGERKNSLANFSITAFGGVNDHQVGAEAIAEWQKFTTAKSEIHLLNGGHLLLESHAGPILQTIKADLKLS